MFGYKDSVKIGCNGWETHKTTSNGGHTSLTAKSKTCGWTDVLPTYAIPAGSNHKRINRFDPVRVVTKSRSLSPHI